MGIKHIWVHMALISQTAATERGKEMTFAHLIKCGYQRVEDGLWVAYSNESNTVYEARITQDAENYNTNVYARKLED